MSSRNPLPASLAMELLTPSNYAVSNSGGRLTCTANRATTIMLHVSRGKQLISSRSGPVSQPASGQAVGQS